MDPLEDYLKRSPLTQSQRADVWDAYHNASDQNALTAALKPLQIPNEVKAGLWDMKGTAKPVQDPYAGQVLTNAPKKTWGDVAQEYFGGATATDLLTGGTLSAIKPFREWYQGTPEQNQARAEGLPMGAPPPAAFVDLAGLALGGGAAAAETAVESQPGRGIIRRILSHPRTKAAGVGAVPGIVNRDPKQILEGATVGAFLGGERTSPGAPVPTLEKPPVFPASMTRAEAEAATSRLIALGKPQESRMLIEAIRAGDIKLTENPPAVAPPSTPQPPRRAVPIPEPGKVKMATIHQPEGSFTMNTVEGRAAEGAAKGSPENLSLAEKQQALIGAEVDNPLIDPRAKPPEKAVPIPDKGKAAVLAHGEVMQAAKAAVKADSTYGEKVWLALDDSGKPAGTFKSEPAARAAAKKIGGKVSWAKNLWSEAKDFQ